MAKFRVIELSFIDGQLRQPGDVVDIEFEKGAVAGANLEPVKATKPAKGGDAEGADLV